MLKLKLGSNPFGGSDNFMLLGTGTQESIWLDRSRWKFRSSCCFICRFRTTLTRIGSLRGLWSRIACRRRPRQFWFSWLLGRASSAHTKREEWFSHIITHSPPRVIMSVGSECDKVIVESLKNWTKLACSRSSRTRGPCKIFQLAS